MHDRVHSGAEGVVLFSVQKRAVGMLGVAWGLLAKSLIALVFLFLFFGVS
jgi:hypothetical protein